MNENRSILNYFDRILKGNKTLVYEAASSSTGLLGGQSVKIPSAGGHAGQSGWQSSNAWDIPAPIGTPVYAISSGTASSFNDYGRDITSTGGKKLYGQGFTVDSDNGLPDVYYTHLEGSPIQKGSKIQCGQFLGYVMDMPDSNYDHVHIGVESGDISQFLNPDGTIKCSGGAITGGYGSQQNTQGKEDTALYQAAKNLGQSLGLKESFGKNTKKEFGKILIPGSSNQKILSPVDGIINNTKFDASCRNQIMIEFGSDSSFLKYCGVTDKKVKNGDKVSEGQLIALMDKNDVAEVFFLDSSYQKQNIDASVVSKKMKKKSSNKDSKRKDGRTYYDPALAGLLLLPKKIFGNVYDKDTGELKVKKWKDMDSSRDVDPWIANAIKKPFQKKNRNETKIQENIKRIKGLL